MIPKNRVVRRIIGGVLNFLTSSNTSGCMRCGDSWSWKKEHTVQYTEVNGMFACCEECWQKLSIEDKKFWCNLLIDKREVSSPRTGPQGHSEQYWIDIRSQVEAAIDRESAETALEEQP